LDQRKFFDIDKYGKVRCNFCHGRDLRSSYLKKHVITPKHEAVIKRVLLRKNQFKDPSIVKALENISHYNIVEFKEAEFRLELVQCFLLSCMPISCVRYFTNFLEKYTTMKRVPDPSNLVIYYPIIKTMEIDSVKRITNGDDLNNPTEKLICASIDGTTKEGEECMILVVRLVSDDGSWEEKIKSFDALKTFIYINICILALR
jgi:hypothetical protein